MKTPSLKRFFATAALAAGIFAAGLPPASAHDASSDISALSLLPVAISVTAPALLLSGAATLTIVSVEASATGTVWVLERASDGARLSVTLSATAAGGVSVAAGTTLACAAISTGWVISAAGRAIAFIPNEVGAALLYNERVTR